MSCVDSLSRIGFSFSKVAVTPKRQVSTFAALLPSSFEWMPICVCSNNMYKTRPSEPRRKSYKLKGLAQARETSVLNSSTLQAPVRHRQPPIPKGFDLG